ncbi:MAG: CCA tRNA nucleotidyltransferase [Ascidiaceihabitans sp.]|nr:CCA tRNA nucleotidyltransferase [Ascidiaceihabitans sp.]
MDRQNELSLPAETPWLNDPKVARVCTAIEDGGYDIFFVGGCVRNVVLDEVASDIDMSTNAHPETVMKLAKDAGLKAIPTGIDHGTVTVVSSGTPYEITTFRCDVETDGRRAVVAFSDDITDDARRRDFTMNALYARPNGSIVDPLGGIQDVLDRRVRFIEDADRRIREDYLRTLRFFRFSAWYGAIDQGFDPDALNAISSNLDGLETLSSERVGMEMVKLLNAPDPAVVVAVMRQAGVLNVVLQGVDDTWLAPLIHVETLLDLPPDPMRRLAALGGTGVETTLRLSKTQARLMVQYRDGIGSMAGAGELAYRLGADVAMGIVALRCAYSGSPPANEMMARVVAGSAAKFPIKASDLMDVFSGPALGKRLKELEAEWIVSEFKKTKEQLL